jgi:hypothetical protein
LNSDHPSMVEFSATGYITFWNLTAGTHPTYEDGFKQLGLEEFTPTRQTPRQSLREATHDLMVGSYVLQPAHRRILKSRTINKRLAVFDVYLQQGPAELSKQSAPPPIVPAFTTRLDKNENVTLELHEGVEKIPHSSYATSLAHLQQMYRSERNTCTPSAVSKSLTATLESLNCTSLRPSRGGIHWIPESKLRKWQAVAEVVDRGSRHSAEKHVPHVHVLSVKRDKDLLIAVKQGLTHSIATAAKALVNDVQDSDLGQRAVENRQKEATILKRKVEEYEEILGETLDHLHVACDMAKTVVAEAVLSRLEDI